jgi:hypothetical protein
MYNNGNSSKNVTGASVVDGTLENADYADNGLSGDKIDGGTLSNVNVDDTTAANIIAQVDDNEISGDKIDGGVISMFQSTGIDDRLPTGKVLTLSDTGIDVTSEVVVSGTGLDTPPKITLDAYNISTSGGGTLGHISFLSGDGTLPGYDIERAFIKTIYEDQYNRVSLSFGTGAHNAVADETVRFLSSGGITFNGDTAAANALDDYEEGTWTPVVAGTSTAGTYSYGTQTGSYTKVGDIVTVSMNLVDITADSAGSGSLKITGLPYSASGTHVGSVWARSINFDGSAAYLVPYSSDSNLYIQEVVDNATGGAVNVADLTSGSARLYINLTYKV